MSQITYSLRVCENRRHVERPLDHGTCPWCSSSGKPVGFMTIEVTEKREQCPATCFVGPGHQSEIRCEFRAGHSGEHSAPREWYEWDEDGECVD